MNLKKLPDQNFLYELHKDIVEFHKSAKEIAELTSDFAEKTKRRVANYRANLAAQENLDGERR